MSQSTTVGIWTPYQRRDATLAALQIADYLGTQHEVHIGTPTRNRPALHPNWDAKVQHNDFLSWYGAVLPKIVIWTHCVNKQDRINALIAAAQGTHVVLLVSEPWQVQHAVDDYKSWNKVIFASQRVANMFRCIADLQNMVVFPWAVGPAATTKERLGTPRTCYIPIHGDIRRGQRWPSFTSFLQFLFKHTKLSITTTKTGLPGYQVAELKTLARLFPHRLRCISAGDVLHEAIQFNVHDLTIDLTIGSTLGMCALQSLQQGTPVIGFAQATNVDFFGSEEPGIELIYRRFGGNLLSPEDYEDLGAKVLTCIEDFGPTIARQLRVASQLAKLYQSFRVGWGRVLKAIPDE